MAEYTSVFVKLYAVQDYLNQQVKDGWYPYKISDPIRTSKVTAHAQQTDNEEAGFSVHIVLSRATVANQLTMEPGPA